MNPPPLNHEETPANPKAVAWGMIIVVMAFGLLFLANSKNLSKVPPEPSAAESFHANVPEAATLISQGERDGLMLLEPENNRVYRSG